MKLGLSTGCFISDAPFRTLGELAKGARYIEMIEEFPFSYSMLDREFARLNSFRKDHGVILNIHSSFNLTNLGHDEDRFRKLSEELLIENIRLLHKLEGSYINTHLGSFAHSIKKFRVDSKMRKRHYERSVESLGRIVRRAEDVGIVITLENDKKDSAYVEPSVFERIFSDLPSENLGFTLDISHAYWNGKERGIYGFLNRLREKLYEIHASDAGKGEGSHKAIGDGAVDWKRLIERLEEIDFDNYFVIETNGTHPSWWKRSKRFIAKLGIE